MKKLQHFFVPVSVSLSSFYHSTRGFLFPPSFVGFSACLSSCFPFVRRIQYPIMQINCFFWTWQKFLENNLKAAYTFIKLELSQEALIRRSCSGGSKREGKLPTKMWKSDIFHLISTNSMLNYLTGAYNAEVWSIKIVKLSKLLAHLWDVSL